MYRWELDSRIIDSKHSEVVNQYATSTRDSTFRIQSGIPVVAAEDQLVVHVVEETAQQVAEVHECKHQLEQEVELL